MCCPRSGARWRPPGASASSCRACSTTAWCRWVCACGLGRGAGTAGQQAVSEVCCRLTPHQPTLNRLPHRWCRSTPPRCSSGSTLWRPRERRPPAAASALLLQPLPAAWGAARCRTGCCRSQRAPGACTCTFNIRLPSCPPTHPPGPQVLGRGAVHRYELRRTAAAPRQRRQPGCRRPQRPGQRWQRVRRRAALKGAGRRKEGRRGAPPAAACRPRSRCRHASAGAQRTHGRG